MNQNIFVENQSYEQFAWRLESIKFCTLNVRPNDTNRTSRGRRVRISGNRQHAQLTYGVIRSPRPTVRVGVCSSRLRRDERKRALRSSTSPRDGCAFFSKSSAV